MISPVFAHILLSLIVGISIVLMLMRPRSSNLLHSACNSLPFPIAETNRRSNFVLINRVCWCASSAH
jgi:hypothetical protein